MASGVQLHALTKWVVLIEEYMRHAREVLQLADMEQQQNLILCFYMKFVFILCFDMIFVFILGF